MTARDPYRVLGLPPDATLDEIKRAYRRLAKIHHPDAGAPTARFLELQAAYEHVLASRGRGARGRGGSGSGPAGGGSGSRPAWQADPARTRATWEQARRRRSAGAGGGSAAGTTGEAAEPGPDGGQGPRTGRTGSASGSGASAASGEGDRTRRRTAAGDRPHRRKARPGSTTYDEAHEPVDPTWHGASWYGVTSGEYWTINPREYADPRKHGPEYQARAARPLPLARGGRSEPVAPDPGPLARPDGEPGPAPAPAGDAAAPPRPDALGGLLDRIRRRRR
jgi:curved DNA-binding protein CbpA